MVSLTDNPLCSPYFCQYTEAGTLSECAKRIYSADGSKDRKPPDMVFKYGGGQWQLAGGIAEVVSGKPWAKLVEEAYVTRCGASSLGYTNQCQKAAGTTRVLSEASVMRMQTDRIAAYGGATSDSSYAGCGLGWWVDRKHAGSVSDPGAYGAVPWLDVGRKYGAMIMLESTAQLGRQLREQARPLVEAAFDALTP